MLPTIEQIGTLGVTSEAYADTWVGRTRRLPNLKTLELRRYWIPIQGPERSHWILRFTRGSGGDWSHLDVEAAGRPSADMLAEELVGLARVFECESLAAPHDVLPLFADFAGSHVAKPEPPPRVLADSPRKARKKARVSKSRRR
jgi:hypothetical protein